MRVRTTCLVKTEKKKKIDSTSPLLYPQLKKTVSSVNTLMQSLKDKIDDLKIPDFGSGLYGDDGYHCVLHNNDTIIASVIADRISGKFEKPDKSTELRLKRQCSIDWIDYEHNHLASARWCDVPLRTRSRLVQAREYTHAWLNGRKSPTQRIGRYDRSFWHFASKAPIEFGPGESFISRQGDVSLFSKLDPHYATVTADLAVIAARFVSINNGLREIFNEAFQRDVGPHLPKRDLDFVGPLEKGFNHYDSPTSFQERVLAWWYKHDLIQRGSRGSSVYKNTKKRRFINIECLMNVVIQKIFGWALRQCLKINAGCDLDLGQDFHKYLIRFERMATVDWSNASDSIVTWTVQQLMAKDTKVFRALDLARSQFVLIDTPMIDCVRPVKQYHLPLKFSSMGNDIA
nr:MAG: RNA-dependent RNA polymerase [Riboviria sp.]